MLLITPTERKVLLGIGIIILAGSVFRFFGARAVKNDTSFKVRPAIEDSVAPLVININEADERRLELLPGVGPVMAKRIVNYRRQWGDFRTASDLEKIKGLGKRKVEVIKAYITF